MQGNGIVAEKASTVAKKFPLLLILCRNPRNRLNFSRNHPISRNRILLPHQLLGISNNWPFLKSKFLENEVFHKNCKSREIGISFRSNCWKFYGDDVSRRKPKSRETFAFHRTWISRGTEIIFHSKSKKSRENDTFWRKSISCRTTIFRGKTWSACEQYANFRRIYKVEKLLKTAILALIRSRSNPEAPKLDQTAQGCPRKPQDHVKTQKGRQQP